MSLDVKQLRGALGRFATGITVVTCRDAAGQRVGLTVNSFNALSLDPPLILWSLRNASPSVAAFEQARHFAVNVLGQAQMPVSQSFASPVPDRFAVGDWAEGEGGAPVLRDALACFECALESVQPTGDHRLFIGRVLAARQAEGEPLIYHAGCYRALGDVL